MRRAFLYSLVLPALFGGKPGLAAGEEAGTPYRLRPPEVAVPEGVEMGQYQRTIRPFPNWILICDENIAAAQRVCNVTQTFEDSDEALVFSWSLAATQQGQPYMILRTAADGVVKDGIALNFEESDGTATLRVELDGCNEQVCVGMLPVDSRLRARIARQARPEIIYHTTDGGTVSLRAPLAGLTEALGAI